MPLLRSLTDHVMKRLSHSIDAKPTYSKNMREMINESPRAHPLRLDRELNPVGAQLKPLCSLHTKHDKHTDRARHRQRADRDQTHDRGQSHDREKKVGTHINQKKKKRKAFLRYIVK